MDDIAINVENLTKIYKLYDKPVDRLKESLHPLRKKYHRDFYALKDISFEVKRGETIGVIGKNGSGKSTLLKIITGVLTQSAGSVQVNGKVSALLELGAGFNHELTGIENIYLNGTIMGYSKEEMDAKLNDILTFAEIDDFVYQSVKTYSSGMFVRLAFAVAISVDPDILIVDEALSVGDMKFQKKCMEKINWIQDCGKTIIFCSHDMHAVSELCDKVYWCKDGEIEECGDSNRVISSYVSYMTQADTTKVGSIGTGGNSNPNYYIRNSEEVEITSIKLYDKSEVEKDVFFTGDDLIFEVTYNSLNGILDPNYSIIIFRDDKIPIGICKTNYYKDILPRGFKKGLCTFKACLKNIQLNKGKYCFGISVWDKAKKICYANNITKEFEIKSLKITYGPTEEQCTYFPDVKWRL